MNTQGLDLHHMTAIVGDAQRNVDFYTQVLGLRLVKLTVNFDDPTAYHLYFGDRFGTPGTGLTFFPYHGRQAKPGPGQVVVTRLAAPQGSLGFWKNRLPGAEIRESRVAFQDPDGLAYEIEESTLPPHGEPWTAVVPEAYALHGMSGVVIQDGSTGATQATVREVLGYQGEGILRTASGRTTVEIRPSTPEMRGHGGSGSVHHIAFRLPDDEAQARYHGDLYDRGFRVSPVMDRTYFHSIYFREPGGVLFELATDGPGFGFDEPEAELGTHLYLPPQYEPLRAQIEDALPKLVLPHERVKVELE